MSQQPPLVLTKNIRIILGQFGIFVVLWCLTVIDYGVKSDRAPLVVSFIKDTGRSQGGLLLQLTWWLRNLSTPRPPIRPFVVLRPAMPAQPANAKLMAQTPVGKPRLRLTTMSFFPLAPVRGLAVSPIGQILASCDVTGRVCLWDAATGFSLKRLGPVGKPLECVVFTNDGRFVAAGDTQGGLYLWEVATGNDVRRWQSGDNTVLSIAFAADGRTLASVGLDDQISLWEVPSGTKLRSWRTFHGGVLAFSPDGKTLAASVPDVQWGSPVLLLDPVTGEGRSGPDSGIGLAFSPDGRILAIGGHRGSLRLWKLATGQLLHSLVGHLGIVTRVAFSPDGQTLASLSSEVRLWDVATGKERCQFRREGNRVLAIAFSGDGNTLFTGGDDTAIRRWDTATGKELANAEDLGSVSAVAIFPDGKTAVTGETEGVIRSWDLETGKLVRKYPGHDKPVGSLTYSSDGVLLASAAGNVWERSGELRLWEASTAKELRRWKTQPPTLSPIHFLSNGKLLASVQGAYGQQDGQGHIWDTATGKELHQFGGNRVAYASFAPDGNLVALWGLQEVQLWDVANRRLVGELRPEMNVPVFGNGMQGYRGILLAAHALSPGAQHLACAALHEGGAIHIFKVATGTELHLPRGHMAMVSALAWSHDGKTLASAGGDGQVWLWDLATASAVLRCEGHGNRVTALAFSADDRTLVSGSDDRTALVWDLTGVRETSNKPHEPQQP